MPLSLHMMVLMKLIIDFDASADGDECLKAKKPLWTRRLTKLKFLESSSLDETIRVLLRLRSLEVQVEKIIVNDVRGDSSTTHRLQNLAHHACGKLSQTLGPCIQPLDQFVTTLESTFIEVQANTTRYDETRSLENEIHHRLDKCTVDFEHDFNRPLLAVSLRAERKTDVAPPAVTTFFQGAQNITINGGQFGHSVDNKVQNQYRWILSILIINTGVLLS